MDWILAHLKLVFIVVSAVAYWINQRRSESAQTKTRPPPRKLEQAAPGGAEDERVRRVQEEIRRKIMERGRSGPVVVTPPIQTRPSDVRRLPPPLRKPVEPPRAVPAKPQRDEEILQRQKKIAEEFRVLEAKRAQIVRAAGNVVESGRLRSEAGWQAAETRLMVDLRDPASLRRAVIMREVLGAPVGLRQ